MRRSGGRDEVHGHRRRWRGHSSSSAPRPSLSRWVCRSDPPGKTYPVPAVRRRRAGRGRRRRQLRRDDGVLRPPLPRRHGPRLRAGQRSHVPSSSATRPSCPNVQVHPFGLHSVDDVVPLYKGDGDTILGSIFRRDVNLDESEPVELRVGGALGGRAGHRAGRRAEGRRRGRARSTVLESLAALLPTVKVLYVEYDSRQARAHLGPHARGHPRAVHGDALHGPGRVHLPSQRPRRSRSRHRAPRCSAFRGGLTP